MALDGELRHLASEQIQELLDQELTPEEEALVQEHLAVCTRCQSEVDSWGLLFSNLAGLPELDPSPAFLQEVLQKAPVWEPL